MPPSPSLFLTCCCCCLCLCSMSLLLQKQRAGTSLRLPNDLIATWLGDEVIGYGCEVPLAVQLVLLPARAVDDTPETPATAVLDHSSGAVVKKVQHTTVGSLPKTTTSATVYLKKVLTSYVVRDKWWCRGENTKHTLPAAESLQLQRSACRAFVLADPPLLASVCLANKFVTS